MYNNKDISFSRISSDLHYYVLYLSEIMLVNTQGSKL